MPAEDYSSVYPLRSPLPSLKRAGAKRITHVAIHDVRIIWSFDETPPHCAQIWPQIGMGVKVEIFSGDILDSYEDSSAVVRALIRDGWVVLKGAANPESIEAARENKPISDLLAKENPEIKPINDLHKRASQLEHSDFDGPVGWQWAKFWERKDELLAVTCYHLLGQESNKWEWEYDQGGPGREDEQTKVVMATGGDVIICNSWVRRRMPKPRDKTDLYLINYRGTP